MSFSKKSVAAIFSFFTIIAALAHANLSDEEIIVTRRLGEPNMQKAATLWYLDTLNEKTLSRNPKYKVYEDEDRENHRREAMNAMKGLPPYTGSWLHAFLLDTGAVASSIPGRVGVAAKILQGNVADKMAQSAWDHFDFNGKLPVLAPGDVQHIGVEMLKAAQDPRHPQYKYAVKLVEDFLNINTKAPLKFNSALRDAKLDKKIRELESQVDRLRKNPNATASDRAQLAQALNELLPQLLEPVRAANLTSKQADNLRWAEHARNLAQTAGLAATVADLSNEPQLAATLFALQGLSSSFGNYFSMTASFEQAPWQYCNIYAAIAIQAYNLFQASQKQKQSHQMEKALQDIMAAIESLRKQMHARLDKIEAEQNRHVALSTQFLYGLDEKTTRMEEGIRNLRKQLEDNHRQVMTAMKDVTNQQINGWLYRCFTSPIKDSVDIVFCRDKFAQMALAQSQIYNGPNTPMQKDPMAALHEALSFNSELSEMLSNWYYPSTWLYGTGHLLALFKKYPAYSKEAITSRTPDTDALTLSNIIAVGESIRTIVSNIALRPSGNSYQLRKDVFESLFDQYIEEVNAAVEKGATIGNTYRKMGPSPFAGVNTPAPRDYSYKFLKTPIQFCSDSSKKIEVPGIAVHSYQQWSKNGGFVADYVTRFSDNDDWRTNISVDPSFIEILPPSAVWASREDLLAIKFCFRRIVFNNFQIHAEGVLPYKFDAYIELEAIGTGTGEIPSMPFVIGKYAYNQSVNTGNYGIADSPCAIPVFLNLWVGQQIKGGNCGGSLNWRPWQIANRANDVFKHIEGSSSYKEFEDKYKGIVAGRKKPIKENFLDPIEGSQKISADRAIRLVVNLGLDAKLPEVRNFQEWLSFPTALMSPQELGRLTAEHVATPQEVRNHALETVKKGRELINSLVEVRTLRPPTKKLDSRIEALRELERQAGVQPSFWERLKFWK